MTAHRIGRDDEVRVPYVVGTAAPYFVPAVGKLVPQPDAHGEIRSELDFILNIPGPFRRTEADRNRIPVQVKLARDIGEEIQHVGIADAARGKLGRPKRVRMDPLEPAARAEGVL